AVAVGIELVECFYAAGLQIAGDTVDHLTEILVRDSETAHGVVEGRPDRVIAEVAVEGFFELGAPALDSGARCAGLVAQIVAIPHEGVDGAHGLALLAGEQNEGVVEVPGARAGDLKAILIGLIDRNHYAACVRKVMRKSEASNRRTRSAFEIAGRAR